MVKLTHRKGIDIASLRDAVEELHWPEISFFRCIKVKTVEMPTVSGNLIRVQVRKVNLISFLTRDFHIGFETRQERMNQK